MTADRDRRALAFLVDRLVLASLDAVGLALAYATWLRVGSTAAAVVTLIVFAGAVRCASAAALGRWGVSVGHAALGMRVVSAADGRPLGLGPALVRTALLDLATVPTLGLGSAVLAWTALVDPSGRRRGWHDLASGSCVVDLRPVPADPPEPRAPARMVNLTTAALAPRPAAPSVGSGA